MEITTFGERFGVVSAEFRRSNSGVAGRQQQTWVRMDDGWRIVAAHVSHLPDEPPAAARVADTPPPPPVSSGPDKVDKYDRLNQE